MSVFDSGPLSPDRARRSLATLRLGLGGTAYLVPRVAARLFAIDPDESPAMASAVRLFGARELVMGIGILGPGPDLSRWLTLGTLADSLDLVTVGLGLRARRLNHATAVIGTAVASYAIVLGHAARRR